MSTSPHELTAADLEDKVATLTLDGAEEADRWLRDNGILKLTRIKKKCLSNMKIFFFVSMIRSFANG